MKRPNILWICTDSQRWDTLGCTGNRFVRTPNIDRLAAEGVLFERAFCQNPLCTPSRSSFLTGRYPRTCRVRQNGQAIPADEILITRLLAEAGYLGGLAGKLHLSPCQPPRNPRQPTSERRIEDGYKAFHWSHHPTPDNLPWPYDVTNEYNLWLKDKGIRYGTRPHPDTPLVEIGMAPEHHQTTWCAEKAIEFLEGAPAYQMPWFFSVNIYDPHHSFDPPEEYLQRYAGMLGDIPLPNAREGEAAGKSPWQEIDRQGSYGGKQKVYAKATAKDHRWARAAYWAMCDQIDTQVGRMLAALEKSGQRENTIVIFMSDHGELLGDHGIYLKGTHFYDPAIRVPLIVSWPGGWGKGRRSAELAELVDLAPTLLEAAGLPRAPGMQGRSLHSLLAGKTEKHRDSAYCEFYNSMSFYSPRFKFQPPPPATPPYATMIRTGGHKLVRYHGTEYGELYDLESDPGESSNRWTDPSLAALKCDLALRLGDRMAETCDPLPVRLADW